MTAQAPVDEFEPPWASYAEFFLHRTDDDGAFLTELDHEAGTREQWGVAEWKARVAATAAWLRQNGVDEGDAVATLAGNTADALVIAYAAWVIGACCVPLNPGDPFDRHAYIVDDAATALLVHSEAHSAAAAFIAERTPVVTRTVRDLPPRDSEVEPGALTGAAGGLDVPALRVYTSGTTGQPKGVVLSARNLLTDVDAVRLAFDWQSDTRILTVLPIHHVNGLVLSSLLPWYAGYSTVLCDRFRTEHFWSDVADEGATVCSMVPSLLEFLLATPGEAPRHFREVLCGAGPLLTQTALDFEDRFGIPIRHLYGLSETTAVVTVTPRLDTDERRRWHRAYGVPSIGAAVPHVEVGVQAVDGRLTGMGERGEIVIRGGVVMQGYAGLPDETDRALHDGWFHSGDEGFWIQETDGEKHFFISGRMKELIIRGGSNISPLEVDSVLRSHPAVDFALAIPFENRFYGEEIAAYVVTNSPVSEQDLLAHCARYLDYARQPKVVIQGDEVPFTATGKAKRIELKERLAPDLAKYRDHQFRRSSAATSTEVSRGIPAGGLTTGPLDPNRSEA